MNACLTSDGACATCSHSFKRMPFNAKTGAGKRGDKYDPKEGGVGWCDKKNLEFWPLNEPDMDSPINTCWEKNFLRI
jgi:hypothetical protein